MTVWASIGHCCIGKCCLYSIQVKIFKIIDWFQIIDRSYHKPFFKLMLFSVSIPLSHSSSPFWVFDSLTIRFLLLSFGDKFLLVWSRIRRFLLNRYEIISISHVDIQIFSRITMVMWDNLWYKMGLCARVVLVFLNRRWQKVTEGEFICIHFISLGKSCKNIIYQVFTLYV